MSGTWCYSGISLLFLLLFESCEAQERIIQSPTDENTVDLDDVDGVPFLGANVLEK